MSLLTAWSRLVIGALASAGVRDVVVSPGSRSTPFVLAAARRGGLRLHEVIDERAAGFFALGLARLGGPPPLLLCTSGTAPAHYYPAIVEASLAELPLVALTADRPPELADCGAPQTIDQTRLFGAHARFFADLGAPDPEALEGLRRLISQAVLRSRYPIPGPVQLNARARKPLEPREPASAGERALEERARAIAERPLALRPPIVLPDPAAMDEALARLRVARRPVIVAGPASVAAGAWREPVFALCRRTGLALLAEATSQLRFAGPRSGVTAGDGFDRWLGGADAPDLVFELGSTPTSGTYARWIAGARPTRVVLGGHGLRDPDASASLFVLGDTLAIVSSLAQHACADELDPSWPERVLAMEERAWSEVERELEAAPRSEGAMTRALLGALPRGALLSVGNSLPIRHVDRFVRGELADLRVLSQRGANGIDGWIAGASAAALAGAPSALLLGDVAFAHDLGSLALAARVTSPLVIVVLDNGGGRIFDQLPIGAEPLAPHERSLFRTPPSVDFAAAAQAFGLPFVEARDAPALRRAVQHALAHPGATLVRACPAEQES